MSAIAGVLAQVECDHLFRRDVDIVVVSPSLATIRISVQIVTENPQLLLYINDCPAPAAVLSVEASDPRLVSIVLPLNATGCVCIFGAGYGGGGYGFGGYGTTELEDFTFAQGPPNDFELQAQAVPADCAKCVEVDDSGTPVAISGGSC